MRDNRGVPHDPHDDSTDSATPQPHEELVDARRGAGEPDSAPTGRSAVDPAESDRIGRDGAGRDGAEADDAEREVAEIASEQHVRVRRTPRYGRFMVLGGAVFGIASFIATYSLPQGTGYDRNTVFGFVFVASIAVGVGVGALAAIIASAATKHTERTVVADRIEVQEPDAASDAPEIPDLGELPAEAEHEQPAPSTGGAVGTDKAAGKATDAGGDA